MYYLENIPLLSFMLPTTYPPQKSNSFLLCVYTHTHTYTQILDSNVIHCNRIHRMKGGEGKARHVTCAQTSTLHP